MDRLIPSFKLSRWIGSSHDRIQRKARMRWTIAYCHGASFQTMAAMSRMPLTPDGINRAHTINPPQPTKEKL